MTAKKYYDGLDVGSVYKYEGSLVYITGGYYTDPTYGRLSNHYSWRKVKKDGSLGKEYSGYGGAEFKPVKFEVTIKVKTSQ